MSSVIGSEGVDVLVPDGVDPNDISVSTDADGVGTIQIDKAVSGLEITATEETTVVSGKKLTDSTVTAKGSKGETSNVAVETKQFQGGTIENKGKGLLEVSVDGSNFKKSTIDAGANKKRDDSISFKGKAKVDRGTVKAGKGDDKIVFGDEVTFKGKTTIDLGKGGKDSIVINADSIEGGKLKVTNFTKKDTITVGDETFTYNDIKNGAEIPNVKIKLA
jgi:hypothetical protein